jgi:Transposase DDE domain group 1
VLQFRGSAITSDAGLLPYRELDHALSLTDTGADALTGRNGRRLLVGLLRQSVFGRLAGHEDVNDANRLYHDPAMHWVVDGSAPMGQFKTGDPGLKPSNPPEIWRMSVLRGRIIVCAFCEVAHRET